MLTLLTTFALLSAPSLAQAPTQLGVAPANRTTCPATHPVKGNVNSKKERIYHVPGGSSYNRTHPERCFRSAAEAQQAGFRAPRN